MVATVDTKISEDEATLYDRQIRLWGLESQKRLRKTRLLVVGLRGVSAEVIKNIVLAGVDTVVMCDHENVSEGDLEANFFLPRNCIGQNRALSAVARIKVLNPTVKVSADKRGPAQLPDAFIKSFNVVIVSNTAEKEMCRINELCRENNIKFYCGDVWGSLGFFFVDLKNHFYVKTIHATPTVPKLGVKRDHDGKSVQNGASAKKNPESGDTVPDTDAIRVTENTTAFAPLSDALNTDFTLPKYATKLRRNKLDPCVFAALALLEFRTKYERNPDIKSKKADFLSLLSIRTEMMERLKVDPKHLPKHYLFRVFGECSSSCSIVGGVLAQEIIHAISGTEPPHKNMFVYNPELCAGRVHYLGP